MKDYMINWLANRLREQKDFDVLTYIECEKKYGKKTDPDMIKCYYPGIISPSMLSIYIKDNYVWIVGREEDVQTFDSVNVSVNEPYRTKLYHFKVDECYANGLEKTADVVYEIFNHILRMHPEYKNHQEALENGPSVNIMGISPKELYSLEAQLEIHSRNAGKGNAPKNEPDYVIMVDPNYLIHSVYKMEKHIVISPTKESVTESLSAGEITYEQAERLNDYISVRLKNPNLPFKQGYDYHFFLFKKMDDLDHPIRHNRFQGFRTIDNRDDSYESVMKLIRKCDAELTPNTTKKYKDVKVIDPQKNISIVCDEAGNQYVQKKYKQYNKNVFERLCQLDIAGIPRFLECDEKNGELTTVEEYISGITLNALLAENGLFSEKTVMAIALQICDILEKIHGLTPPLIHRDIKPSNIILRDNGEVVLIDFNASREFYEGQSQDTVLIGTHYFAAPEQLTGYNVSDERTDIYNLGATMNYLLTEMAPGQFTAPGALHDIIIKCTKMDKENRYQNVNELRDAINRAY